MATKIAFTKDAQEINPYRGIEFIPFTGRFYLTGPCLTYDTLEQAMQARDDREAMPARKAAEIAQRIEHKRAKRMAKITAHIERRYGTRTEAINAA